MNDLLISFSDVIFIPFVRVGTDELLVETDTEVVESGESQAIRFFSCRMENFCVWIATVCFIKYPNVSWTVGVESSIRIEVFSFFVITGQCI